MDEAAARPDWRACVEVFLQLGAGLAAAHAEGLVHRDFKPGNAIIDIKGRARVLDFGLARQADDGKSGPPSVIRRAHTDEHQPVPLDMTLTKTGDMVGTPACMPLEQMEVADADVLSDQFSFCVALYEAVYGERPSESNTLAALVLAVEDGRVRPASKGSEVPSGTSRSRPQPTRRASGRCAALSARPQAAPSGSALAHFTNECRECLAILAICIGCDPVTSWVTWFHAIGDYKKCPQFTAGD